MKKITLLLFALAAFSKPAFSQAVISVDAPQYNGDWAALIGPNGFTSSTITTAYSRACYLITQAELTRMAATNSVVTRFGFDFYRIANVPTTGQFTLYLQNTADVSYNKGLTYSSILTGMSTNYTGTLTVPGSTNFAVQNSTAAVSVPLSSNFTYTGGGIYVAFDWYAATPTATNFARYLSMGDPNTSLGANAFAGSAGPAPATLTVDVRRPAMRFSAGNLATNEVGVVDFFAPGLDARPTTGHPAYAVIQNNGINAINNVPVTLKVSGANTYSFVQNTGNIAPGGTTTVTFPAYTSTVSGTNSMTLTVDADQYVDNNGRLWTQSVTCVDYGNSLPVAANSYSDNSIGFGGQSIIVTPFKSAVTCSMTGVKYAPSEDGSGSMCGVLTDATGSIIAMTNTLNLAASAFGSFANFKFTPAIELAANTDYFFGVAQLSTGVYPFGVMEPFATDNVNKYYYVPIGGGAIGAVQNILGYLGIQAVVNFSQTTIDLASASTSVICKQDGANSVTITAFGGSDSYVWTPGNLTGDEIVVTPTVAGLTGTVNYIVTGTDNVSKCKSNAVTVKIVVNPCTAISSNTSNGYDIKLYPNPSATGKSTLSGLIGTNFISVYNTLGQIVATQKTTDETTEIDLSSQPSGNYMVKIASEGSEARLVKLVK